MMPAPSCTNCCCNAVRDDFNDGSIDSRWTQSGATWTEAGGRVYVTGGNVTLKWNAGFPAGDDTELVAANFQCNRGVETGAAQATLIIGNEILYITMESSPGADDGWIALSSNGVQVAVPGLVEGAYLTATLCRYGNYFVGTAKGTSATDTYAGFVAGNPGIGTGVTQPGGFQVTAYFDWVYIGHKLDEPECDVCFSLQNVADDDCTEAFPDYTPDIILASLAGPFGDDEVCEPGAVTDCSQLEHSWFLKRDSTFDGIGNCGCFWGPAGYFPGDYSGSHSEGTDADWQAAVSRTPFPWEAVICEQNDGPDFGDYQRVVFILAGAYIYGTGDLSDGIYAQAVGAYWLVFENAFDHKWYMTILSRGIQDWALTFTDLTFTADDMNIAMPVQGGSACFNSLGYGPHEYCDFTDSALTLSTP